jgi:hypothetical protein
MSPGDGNHRAVGARGAFLEGLVAVVLEHQRGGAPDVDFRYHAPEAIAWRCVIGAKKMVKPPTEH